MNCKAKLHEKIEDLRQELIRVREKSIGEEAVIRVSRKLDKLIVRAMEEEFTN